jgi:hypothetical protein
MSRAAALKLVASRLKIAAEPAPPAQGLAERGTKERPLTSSFSREASQNRQHLVVLHRGPV